MSETDFGSYLADNPRMIGVLFTLLVLLMSAGNAAGAAATIISGP